MIQFEGVRAGYGRREVLREVSFQVAEGEMVGLLGPNGGGKTTLVNVLSGVLSPMGGRVRIRGVDLHELSARQRARTLAVVPQRLGASFGPRVGAVVLMGRYAHSSWLGGYGPEDERAAREALALTRALDLWDRRLDELSGGETQRVLIARALAQEAPILVLDEAAAHLDVARKVEIYELLKTRNRAGMTVLSVVHDLNLAALYCRRLLFLKAGRLALDGPTSEVFTEENLTEIYETPILVAPHPVTGAPQAHLAPGSAGASGPGSAG